ncbi:PLC-like phosphodiesterase [Gautieria morchelliformis]|nr:PLC-like phosphodiesterase [Gautieria morchelliformis]
MSHVEGWSPALVAKQIAIWSGLIISLPWTALAGLDPLKMAQHLEAGKPILGTFTNSGAPLPSWMGDLHDSTPIQSINVPGTHDTATWNYTGLDESVFRTQDRSIFDQLDAGIRFLDIRFGLDENTNVLRLYHADTLLSNTASLEDVLWGLYHFLDNHPTETLLVSMKVDHGADSLPVQKAAHALITTPPVKDYWLQSSSLPPNLGGARKKIILFRRFGFDTANNPDLTPVGLDVASGWTDNNADFSITYNPGDLAYIEDLYQLNGDAIDVPPATKVQQKFSALTAHINNSRGSSNVSQVFISFASGFGAGVGDILTPRTLAEGDSSIRLVGINQKMDGWLVGCHGKRLGIVLYDFFQSAPDLIRKTIGLSPDDCPKV